MTASLTAEEECSLVAARYDEDGRMVEVNIADVPKGESQVSVELEP